VALLALPLLRLSSEEGTTCISYGPPADIYSFGIVLQYLWTGPELRLPVEESEAMADPRLEVARRLRDLYREEAVDVEDAVCIYMRMTCIDPTKRGSATELKLDKFYHASLGQALPRPVSEIRREII